VNERSGIILRKIGMAGEQIHGKLSELTTDGGTHGLLEGG